MEGLFIQVPKKTFEEEIPKEPEIEPLADNEFFCTQCTFRNTFNNKESRSAFCKMCGVNDKETYDKIWKALLKDSSLNSANPVARKVCSECGEIIP